VNLTGKMHLAVVKWNIAEKASRAADFPEAVCHEVFLQLSDAW